MFFLMNDIYKITMFQLNKLSVVTT